MHPEDRNRWLLMIAFAAIAMIVVQMMFKPKDGDKQPNRQSATAPETGPAGTGPAQPPPAATDIRQEGDARLTEVTTDELQVSLSPVGASIETLALVNHHRNRGETAPLVLIDAAVALDALGPRRSMVLRDFHGDASAADFEHWPFRLESDDQGLAKGQETRTILYRARQGNMEVAKAYVFRKSGFDIELTVTVTNHAKERDKFEYNLVGVAGLVPDEPKADPATITAKLAGRGSPAADMEYRDVTAAGAPDEKPDKLLLSQYRTEWAALRGRFFGAILAPVDPESAITAFAEPLDPRQTDKKRLNLTVGVKAKSINADPGRPESRGYLMRVGPLIAEQLEKYEVTVAGAPVSRGMLATLTFSWSLFDRPSRWMLSLLEWSKGVIGNYGWGIVLMTLIVKLCLHPLQRKGMIITQRNQEKMQAMAPKLKELQEQYKDDSAKLQQATMRLYKEEGFNPAGMALGCLPMVIQTPVWIALYGSIMGAFGLRQASFLWIGDLSRPDTVLAFNFWPHELNLLPIIYAGLMAAQSFMTPLPVDPQQRQQAWMMRFIPLMFFLFFYNMSSAFVLYFVTNGVLGIGETWMIKKQMAKAKARDAAKALAAGVVPAGASGKDAPKPAPVTDPAAFWAKEGEEKLGKGKK